MIIGVPKEVKIDESRVGLTPDSVAELISHGHAVIIEQNAGKEVGCDDAAYQQAGADIVATAAEVFAQADMIIKVKEPQPQECLMLRQDQILFAYLHLAADKKQTELLQRSGCIAIAYETVTNDSGRLPLLSPMSAVAGRMSIQVGAHYLEQPQGGSGILVGGVEGIEPATVTIIGGGVVGVNAAMMAIGMGANVTIFEKSAERVEQLEQQFGQQLAVKVIDRQSLGEHVIASDLAVGSVLVPGEAAPTLIDRSLLRKMRAGSVLVDVAIDQGGCFETSRPTNHQAPVYVEEGVAHYCVTNMPGAVPRTSTYALNYAALPFISELANKGMDLALAGNNHLLNGLNVYRGQITCEGVAKAFAQPYLSPQQAIGI